MTLQNFYEAIGGDYEKMLRLLSSEKFILKYVAKFPQDPTYQTLCDSLAQNDWKEAFRAVHTLKGLCLNLGFQNLLDSSIVLTELLRPEKAEIDGTAVDAAFARVRADYEALIARIQVLLQDS